MDWCCIAAVNNETILSRNLYASSSISSEPERLTILKGQPSASIAYNAGLEQTTARYCVFAHQDVYLPNGWIDHLATEIASLESIDNNWAVAGLFGVSERGIHVGRVWSTGIGKELGKSFKRPIPVQSIDELIIIIDRNKGLKFDPKLPGFHLYGTDIVQQALAAGLGAYVIHAPVIHNSQRVRTLNGPFLRSHDYLSKKWKTRLPIRTPVTIITPLGIEARKLSIKISIKTIFRKTNKKNYNPIEIAQEIGYNNLL